jgi:hypothetical protein
MKRRITVSIALALSIGLVTLTSSATAHATQLMDGMTGIKAYQIQFSNRIIGAVVIVSCDNPNPPPGYASGQEYWSWRAGAAWRGTFTLIPVETVPDYYSYSWEMFPHEHFDFSRTVPMPLISPEPSDKFYRVQVRKNSRWINQGWMWLINGTAPEQEWYGRNLTSDLVGNGGAIRFTSAEPPAPGRKEVYLLNQ